MKYIALVLLVYGSLFPLKANESKDRNWGYVLDTVEFSPDAEYTPKSYKVLLEKSGLTVSMDERDGGLVVNVTGTYRSEYKRGLFEWEERMKATLVYGTSEKDRTKYNLLWTDIRIDEKPPSSGNWAAVKRPIEVPPQLILKQLNRN